MAAALRRQPDHSHTHCLTVMLLLTSHSPQASSRSTLPTPGLSEQAAIQRHILLPTRAPCTVHCSCSVLHHAGALIPASVTPACAPIHPARRPRAHGRRQNCAGAQTTITHRTRRGGHAVAIGPALTTRKYRPVTHTHTHTSYKLPLLTLMMRGCQPNVGTPPLVCLIPLLSSPLLTGPERPSGMRHTRTVCAQGRRASAHTRKLRGVNQRGVNRAARRQGGPACVRATHTEQPAA
eukprot:4894024-Prymnesium_polylepis.1